MITESQKKTIELFEPEIHNLGKNLMNHQCWNFGCDIFHPSGNLLIHYGFERFGAPKGKTGGNSYRMYLDENTELVLWGFGIFLGESEKGGIFINRFDFSPKILSSSRLALPITESDQLPPNHKPLSAGEKRIALEKTVRVVDWIIKYESWTEKKGGKNWRKRCLDDWKKAKLEPNEIKSGWKDLRGSVTHSFGKTCG